MPAIFPAALENEAERERFTELCGQYRALMEKTPSFPRPDRTPRSEDRHSLPRQLRKGRCQVYDGTAEQTTGRGAK